MPIFPASSDSQEFGRVGTTGLIVNRDPRVHFLSRAGAARPSEGRVSFELLERGIWFVFFRSHPRPISRCSFRATRADCVR